MALNTANFHNLVALRGFYLLSTKSSYRRSLVISIFDKGNERGLIGSSNAGYVTVINGLFCRLFHLSSLAGAGTKLADKRYVT